MYEVTRDNFDELLPVIKEQISQASFVAIDCVFSGPVLDITSLTGIHDVGKDCYHRMKKSLSQVAPLQVGLTIFELNVQSKTFKAKVFNFYIMQPDFHPMKARLSLSSSSKHHLSKIDFDLNKWVKSHLSYVNSPQEVSIRAHMKSKSSWRQIQSNSLNETCEVVRVWAASPTTQENDMKVWSSIESQRPEYIYLLHLHIREAVDNVWTSPIKEGVLVSKVSTERRNYLRSEPSESTDLDEYIVDELLGFSKIIHCLVQCETPIIGHNVFVHVAMIYQNFIEDLPDDYNFFKAKFHRNFPYVFDTKFMAAQIQTDLPMYLKFSDYSLKHIFTSLASDPSFISPLGICQPTTEFDLTQEKLHDVGWNSYRAGYSFIKLSNATSEALGYWSPDMNDHHPYSLAAKMRNKLLVTGAAVPFIFLAGSDPPPVNKYLRVSGIGEHRVTMAFILQQFSKYGRVDAIPDGNQSLIVGIRDEQLYRKLLKHYKGDQQLLVEPFLISNDSWPAKFVRTALLLTLPYFLLQLLNRYRGIFRIIGAPF